MTLIPGPYVRGSHEGCKGWNFILDLLVKLAKKIHCADLDAKQHATATSN